MKYFYSIIIIFVFSINAESTERTYLNYTHSNLNFSFCYNLTSYDPLEHLYYKGLSTLINEHIIEKVQNGELDNRKFEIQAGCTIFGSHPSIEVSRNKNGFFVFIHGGTNLYQLVRVIDYFASDSWQSFCYDIEKTDPNIALKTFNGILDKVIGSPKLDILKKRNIKVWQRGRLKIYFKSDALIYSIDDQKFDYKVSNPLPANLRERLFIVKNSTIHVIEENKIVLEQTIPDFDDEMPYFYSIVPYKDWLNVYYGQEPVLSYSYEKNRFYKILKNHIKMSP